MMKPTSKKLRVAGAITLAAGVLGARSAPATAGATPGSTLAAASAKPPAVSVGVAAHDDGGDGGDGGDGNDGGDDTGNDRGMTP